VGESHDRRDKREETETADKKEEKTLRKMGGLSSSSTAVLGHSWRKWSLVDQVVWVAGKRGVGVVARMRGGIKENEARFRNGRGGEK